MSTVLFAVSTSVYLLALARIVQVIPNIIIIIIFIIITIIITTPTRVYPLPPTSPPAKQCLHTLSRENHSVLFLAALLGEWQQAAAETFDVAAP